MWNIGGAVVQAAAQLLMLTILSRVLSPTQLGVAVLILAAQMMSGTFRFAISLTVGREVARGLPDSASVGEAHGLTAAGGSVALIAGLAVAAALAADGQAVEAATLVACTVAIAADIATLPYAGVLIGTASYGTIGRAAAYQGIAAVLVTAALAPTIGLFAVGIAQLVRVATQSATVIPAARAQLARRHALRAGFRRPSLRYLGADVGPLVVLSTLIQLAVVLDLAIVSAVVSTAAAGSYRIGFLVPSQLSGLIFRAWDTAFARLAGASHEARIALARRLFMAFGGCGIAMLAAMMVSATPIVVLLEGRRDPTAETVVALFAAYLSVIVAVHGMALLLMADGQQRGIVALAVAQTVAQAIASVVLAMVIGATGPAFATAIVVGFTSLFVFPRVAMRLHPDARAAVVMRTALAGFAAGAGIGGVSLLAIRPGDSQLLSFATLTLTGALLTLGMFAYARRRGFLNFLRVAT